MFILSNGLHDTEVSRERLEQSLLKMANRINPEDGDPLESTVITGPEGKCLGIVLGGNLTVVNFWSQDWTPPAYISLGNCSQSDFVFKYFDAYTEVDGKHTISLENGWACVLEFLKDSSSLPQCSVNGWEWLVI